MFLAQQWALKTSSRFFHNFMILMKWQFNKTRQFLVVGIYHFQFSLIHPFRKIKHWEVDIIGSCVIVAGC